MKIYYIYHSCFIVETESSFVLFDYFKNKQNNNEDFNFNELLNDIFISEKPLYVFSSHSHQDHFNSEILSWCNKKENTYFILSNDIKLYQTVSNYYSVKKNDSFTINNLTINTFNSTDQGVSFLIALDNMNIFHAGDLNWWKWSDDTIEEEEEMESAFKGIIKDIIIKDVIIDIAFFPVDGRLDENYFCGGKYFIEQLNPKVFIPMHFWDNFDITKQFKNHINVPTRVIELHHNNEIIMMN